MPDYHILNLGAGVQSTTIYLMYLEGLFTPGMTTSIFADTQDEPKAVYRHLQWLISLGGPEIKVRTRGCLGDNLKVGMNGTGQRFISIPAYTKPSEVNAIFKAEPEDLSLEYDDGVMPDGRGQREGMIRRQCTQEYKLVVIHDTIRREVLGLQKGDRIPKDVTITNIIGISMDEIGRMYRIRDRETKKLKFRFPLIEMEMTRQDCINWLQGRVPHEVPRSACVYCPFHDDNEWLAIKESPEDWARAVEIDEALRIPGNVVNRGMDALMYLHESCVPLKDVVLRATPRVAKPLQLGFWRECKGMCGL
jgi:hypothetical protein